MRIAVGRGLLFSSKRRPGGSVDGSGSGRAPSLAGPSLSRRIFGPVCSMAVSAVGRACPQAPGAAADRTAAWGFFCSAAFFPPPWALGRAAPLSSSAVLASRSGLGGRRQRPDYRAAGSGRGGALGERLVSRQLCYRGKTPCGRIRSSPKRRVLLGQPQF